MTDDLLPITPLAALNAIPVKQPKGPRGFGGSKIARSRHKEIVTKWLLQGLDFAEVQRRLKEDGFFVSPITVASFYTNYVKVLDTAVQAKIVEADKKEDTEKNEAIVDEVAHGQISRVDSLKKLIISTETKIKAMDAAKSVANQDMMTYGNYLDRLARYREELETAQKMSEIEREREKALRQLFSRALVYLKRNEDKTGAIYLAEDLTALLRRQELPKRE
jgi:hypothetical protein